MKLSVQVEINDSKERVWNAISDIENSVHMISGIEKIEVLEKPEADFVGDLFKHHPAGFIHLPAIGCPTALYDLFI